MVKKKPKINKKSIQKGSGKLWTDYDKAYDFSIKAYQKFREIVKSIALFGSVPKKVTNEKSDIDIIIIIDDATINWDQELIAWYREELSRLISSLSYGRSLHVNTITLTTFWEEVKAGEPLVINVLRYGEVLIDFGGFFDALKSLLAKGRIRPTPEAVFVTMERGYSHFIRGNNNILGVVEAYYWACVDVGHAALMAENVIPPSPEHLSELITEIFVNTKRVDKKYVAHYDEIRKIAKGIVHGEIKNIEGKKIQELKENTEKFVQTFVELTKFLIKNKKIIKIEHKKII